MGKYDYQKSYARQMESIIVAVCAIYGLVELALGYRNDWNQWGQATVLGSILVTWVFFFGKYGSYETRAYITTCMSQVIILVYGVECGDFYLILSTFISLCILLGLYGVPKSMIFPFISYSILLYYYIFVKKDLVWGSYTSDLGMVMRILQGYLVLFVVFYLVYRYKYSQDSMLEMIDALRKSEREKDDFLANVSHEIRTPINTICGISELMLKNELPEEMKEDVLNIQSAGRNLMSVVGDILDYSELQEGEFELVEEKYYISSTIYDVINMTMAKKSEKNLELIVNCDANMPSMLIGDEQKIRRVIMNLVNNAIEFTNEGCVSINFGFRKEEYGINLIVSIRDSGIGMAKEGVEKLFDKFIQVDMGRNRQRGGIGLGLAIAQTIVNKMGGFITVKSELGKGSEFKFVIPQKIYDEKPIVSMTYKEEINAAVYINMEQFHIESIRNEYAVCLRNIIRQLNVKAQICRNIHELKRWEKRAGFGQVFISLAEYQEDPVYFDNLAKRTKVYVIIDHYDDTKIQNKLISKIYKPFFVLSVVSALENSIKEMAIKNIELENHQLYAPNAHVLIIDDNRMNIRVVEGLMREYGVRVSYALSGQEGIDMLESKEYDLIFLDHMMPGMDGVETFKHIRHKQDPYFKEIPIIALTANAIAGAREMFMKEGFTDFLAKPIESSVLQRTLKRHLPADKQMTVLDMERMQEEAEEKRIAARQKLEKEKAALKNVAMVQSQQKEQPKTEVSDEFVIGDLDVQKGLTYCGSKANYLSILETHRDSSKDMLTQACELLEKEDWKNYTIVVHGIKSSMLSIGAVKLSEMAMNLESAGKDSDYTYIRTHHQVMAEEFTRVMKLLEECPYLSKKETIIATVNKPALSDEAFAFHLRELESATYEFDANKMIPILNVLSKHSYNGKDMEQELKPVYKKVEMFDFMSAYETVAKMKEKA